MPILLEAPSSCLVQQTCSPLLPSLSVSCPTSLSAVSPGEPPPHELGPAPTPAPLPAAAFQVSPLQGDGSFLKRALFPVTPAILQN